MRVLRIIARLNVGGPARHAIVLGAGLQRHNVESLLVYGSVGPDEGSLEDLVAANGLRAVKVPWLGRRISAWGDLRALWALTRLIFREQPDIVHTHTAKAGALGRVVATVFNATRRRERRCAIIHTFHGHVFTGYFTPVVSRVVRWIERALAGASDRIVAISNIQREEICQRFGVAPPWKTEVIELGLNLDTLLTLESETSLRRELGFGLEHVVFGYVGRLVPIKDLPTLLQAFARIVADIPNARLMLVGDGELRHALEAFAAELGLGDRVRFAGWRHDLSAVYGAMDACVLSSRNEGTPVALIEAMAAGKPVIATAVGGVEDVVTQGCTGVVVPPGDVAALADAMRGLGESESRRREFGQAARRSIGARFGASRLASDANRLYLRALVERRRLPASHEWAERAGRRPLRTIGVIARLNVGGPAHHAVVLSDELKGRGFEPLLVHGSVDLGEGSLEYLANKRRYRVIKIPQLGRQIRPWDDLEALYRLVRLMYRERPDVVHTHTAKAGTLGRLAALTFNVTRRRHRRCVVIHTFHGHVFSGYFGPVASAVVKKVEQAMALISDRIVTISASQRHDICQRYGIAPEAKTEVVELGIDLDSLLTLERDTALRQELGYAPEDIVFGYVGRLAPIKNLPLLIRAFARVAVSVPRARLMLVGDGELRDSLGSLVRELALGPLVRFTGWQRNLEAVYGAMDVCVLTSRNEGTPMALIEALAAARPVVATAVGGVVDVVRDGATGLIVPSHGLEALAGAMLRLARDPAERQRFGAAGREEMARRFSLERLVSEMSGLYLRAIAAKRGRHSALEEWPGFSGASESERPLQ